MAPQSYQLVLRTGPNAGKDFELSKNEITIGRDISNDIVINDAEVSRHHARLISQSGGYVVEDTGSTNGTFVNGQRLMGPHMLRPGETIFLGENISLAYEPVQYDPDATMVAASNVPSMPPSEPEPPRREMYTPPPTPEPAEPPPPAYSAPAQPGPVEVFPVQEEPPQRSRTWLYVGCGCLLLVLCVLVGAAIAFDQLNLYCTPPFNTFFPCG